MAPLTDTWYPFLAVHSGYCYILLSAWWIGLSDRPIYNHIVKDTLDVDITKQILTCTLIAQWLDHEVVISICEWAIADSTLESGVLARILELDQGNQDSTCIQHWTALSERQLHNNMKHGQSHAISGAQGKKGEIKYGKLKTLLPRWQTSQCQQKSHGKT